MKAFSVDIKKSPKKDKKLRAIFKNRDGKVVKQTDFGLRGASDFTIHKDRSRRNRYRKRHLKDLDTKDFKRAGYLSFYVLWNKENLEDSIKDYKRTFNLR